MRNNPFFSTSNNFIYAPPPSCHGVFPVPSTTSTLLRASTYEYITISDGTRRTYTNNHGLSEYESSVILDPANVSYINLFVNGVLQPSSLYSVGRGILIFDSEDVPPKDYPILLQFIIIEIIGN